MSFVVIYIQKLNKKNNNLIYTCLQVSRRIQSNSEFVRRASEDQSIRGFNDQFDKTKRQENKNIGGFILSLSIFHGGVFSGIAASRMVIRLFSLWTIV